MSARSIRHDCPFSPRALETNRCGRLTDEQRRMSRAVSRRSRWWELGGAALAVFLGIAFALPGRTTGYIQPGSSTPPAALKPVLAVGLVVLGAGLLWRALTGTDALTRDLRGGEVRWTEGAILKSRWQTPDLNSGGGSGNYVHRLTVGGDVFTVPWESAWRGAPDVGHVRLFYLPRSRTPVNVERLPDPPLPEVTRESLIHAGKDLGVAMVSPALFKRNRIRKAEAAAQLSAMAVRLREQLAQAATPPPPDQRDGRPLAEALVGTWSDGLLTLAIRSDGTMTVGGRRGRRRSGRWSIDSDGRLHAIVMENGEASDAWVTEAWVAGDELTIVRSGVGWKLRRSSV